MECYTTYSVIGTNSENKERYNSLDSIRKKDYNKILLYCVLAVLLVINVIRLFYKLGRGGLEVTDEAWYGVNAYEMLQSGNWLVPTLRYQVDYASKPPLGLWGILIGFKLLGVNLVGLRMYSAVAGLLTILLICFYFYKRYDIRYSIVAAAAFPALFYCFKIHMYRAGDMDALFGLWYLVAIIALAEVARNNSVMFILYGLAVGLGFMTRSTHVAFFIIVGALFLPVIWKKLSVKEVLLSAVAAILPNAIWMMARYRVDGFKYILSITFGETTDGVCSGITLEYFKAIAKEKVTWVLIALILIRIVLYFAGHQNNIKEARTVSFKSVLTDLGGFCKDKYLLILAFGVPLVMYSLAGKYMMWYSYSAYIVMVMIVAVEAVEVSEKLSRRSGALGNALQYCVVAACALYACIQIDDYKNLGTGGNPIDQFTHDMTEFRIQTNSEYDGYKAYIAYDRNRHAGDRGHWELDYTFVGYTSSALNLADGGVEGFLADEDSLLIIDSSLWKEYVNILDGYVFLENNTYYVLSHDRYKKPN